MATNVCLADYNNAMYSMLLERQLEFTIGHLRSEFEAKHAENLRIFEEKMNKEKSLADERLGQLMLLPKKIEEVNNVLNNNKVR